MSNSKSGRGSLLAEGSQRLWHLRVVWVPSYYLHSVYPGPGLGASQHLSLIDPFLLPLH